MLGKNGLSCLVLSCCILPLQVAADTGAVESAAVENVVAKNVAADADIESAVNDSSVDEKSVPHNLAIDTAEDRNHQATNENRFIARTTTSLPVELVALVNRVNEWSLRDPHAPKNPMELILIGSETGLLSRGVYRENKAFVDALARLTSFGWISITAGKDWLSESGGHINDYPAFVNWKPNASQFFLEQARFGGEFWVEPNASVPAEWLVSVKHSNETDAEEELSGMDRVRQALFGQAKSAKTDQVDDQSNT